MPLHCVVTDLVTFHRCWACEAVDAFYVATPAACDALIAMGIPRERMVTMAQSLLASAFQAARCGIVFNVMSRHVDWEHLKEKIDGLQNQLEQILGTPSQPSCEIKIGSCRLASARYNSDVCGWLVAFRIGGAALQLD